jgi:hypothetical protein
LGSFREGFFRDSSGNAVGFVNGASGGPLLPLRSLPPLPPLPSLPPLKPLPSLPPIAPMPSLSWSNRTWDEFLEP